MSAPAQLAWPDLIGWQHEVVHTAALAHALQVPGDRAGRLERFLGFAEGTVAEQPFGDGWSREIKIGDTRRRADLGGDVCLTPDALPPETSSLDAERTWVLVETKVDSMCSREQLVWTAAHSDHSVLVLLGATAFDWRAEDLIAETGFAIGYDDDLPVFGKPHDGPALAPLPDEGRIGQMPAPTLARAAVGSTPRRCWHRIAPRELLDLLQSDAAICETPLLAEYVRCLERESDAQEQAWQLAAEGLARPASWAGREALLSRAFLGQVRVAMRRAHRSRLNVLTRTSAGEARLEFYPAGWSRGDHTEQDADLMLYLVVPHGRAPALKLRAGAGSDAIERMVERGAIDGALRTLQREFDGSKAHPRKQSASDTRTLWSLTYAAATPPSLIAQHMLDAASFVNERVEQRA